MPETLGPSVKPAYEESFIPGWMPRDHARKIFNVLLKINAVRALEIGSFMGRSSHVIASAMHAMGGERKLVCVDLFGWTLTEEAVSDAGYLLLRKNYPEASRLYFDEYGVRSSFGGFHLTLERFPYMKSIVEMRVQDSRHLDLGAERFDFAFLDGGHDYATVRSDFEKIRPNLRPGAVLCLDDNTESCPGVRRLVSELAQRPDLRICEAHGKMQFFRVPGAEASDGAGR